jgi:hypothetical protein
LEREATGDCLVMGKLTTEQEAEAWWEDALDQLDQDGDKKRLTQLLRSDLALTPLAREWMADLIECRCVPLPRGRRKTLAYRPTDKAIDHWLARDDIKRFRKAGMSEADALQKAAKVNGLTVTALKLSREGHHRSFRESQLNPSLKRKHSKKKNRVR